MKITVTNTLELKQAWMSKDEAIAYFGYKDHKSTFQKLLAEFKEHPKFGKGYLLPTYKVQIIHVEKFTEFLVWRDKNKFK